MMKRFGRLVTGTLIAASVALFLVGCGQSVTAPPTDQDQQVQTLEKDQWW